MDDKARAEELRNKLKTALLPVVDVLNEAQAEGISLGFMVPFDGNMHSIPADIKVTKVTQL